jgi:hypothetical protein
VYSIYGDRWNLFGWGLQRSISLSNYSWRETVTNPLTPGEALAIGCNAGLDSLRDGADQILYIQ